MTKDPYEENIKSKCSVCGQNIMVNQYGNGNKCNICGWKQDSMGDEFPDRVIGPNYVSLNKAILLYNENKPLIPDFLDFIGMLMFYGEVEFTYKRIIYGVIFRSKKIEMFAVGEELFEIFDNEEDFFANAKIDNKFVKDIWPEVENADWLQ